MSGKQGNDDCGPLVITAIHGTFDTTAHWVDPNSPIPVALGNVIGNCIIERVKWSGHNSELDRISAIERLGEHVKKISIRFPQAPHILIGHSHGGNIIRDFLLRASPDTIKLVAGAIAVSTPCRDFSPRDYVDNVRALSVLWRFSFVITLSLLWLIEFKDVYPLLGDFGYYGFL